MTTWLRCLPYTAALLIGAAGAWFWQANSYETIIANNEAARQADLARISAAGVEQVRQAVQKLLAAEQALATLDQKAQKEKADALAENDKLRAAVASGARRLRIAGTYSAGSGNMPSATSTASLGDAGTVELSAASGSTIFDIRAGVVADQAALKALQAYVTNVCHGPQVNAR
jgi:prophage endopeptidase